jgi:hypothetical protein
MAETNSKSIASFTLGILSIVVPSIGLILGIIGIFVSRLVSLKLINPMKRVQYYWFMSSDSFRFIVFRILLSGSSGSSVIH